MGVTGREGVGKLFHAMSKKKLLSREREDRDNSRE